MYRFKLTTRFKITIVLLALAVVLSIGGTAVIANMFLGGGGAAGNINLEKGLVGHWDFGAGSTTAATPDRTPNNNDGTVTAATLTTDRKGQGSNAYNFNGSTAEISAGDPADGSLETSSAMSISVWIKTGTLSVSKFIASKWDGTNGFRLYYYYTNYLNLFIGAQNGQITVDLEDNVWHHIVGTWDGTSTRIYVDGVLPAGGTDATGTTLAANTGSFRIGFADGGAANGHWLGDIDDVRYYNRTLSQAEISALYESYNPSVVISDLQKGLVGHWKMDGTAQDATPYNNDGTLVADAVVNGSDRKGQSSKALTLDGTGDYVNVGGGQSFGTGDFSVSAWVKPASLLTVNVTANQAIVSDGEAISGADYPGWQLQWYQWDGWRFIAGAGVTSPFASIVPDTSAPAVWTHLVGVRTSTDVKLYVNGVVYSVDGVAQNVNNSVNQLIGEVYTFQYTGQTFNGLIDDVRIYNRALSAAEVTALYNSYDPGIAVSTLQKGLIGWWNFDGTAQDSTPYNKDGTVTGATLTTDRRSASNKAYSFDGTDDVIDMGATHVVANGDTRSFAFWVNPSDNGVYDFILGKSNGCGNYGQYTIRSAAGGVSFNYVNDAATITDYTGPAATVGTWSHYVITYTFGTGSSMAMYKNGALASGSWDADAGNLVVTGTYLGNLNLGKFGTCTGADYHFAGSIDDVRIYNRALTAAEVLDLYNSYK